MLASRAVYARHGVCLRAGWRFAMIDPRRCAVFVFACAGFMIACDGDSGVASEASCEPPLHPYTECLGDCTEGFQIEVDEDGCTTCECQPVANEESCEPPLHP